MSYHKKILIIAPPWVGDMVMTQALLMLLKKQDPSCTIDVFAIPLLHPIIYRMPEVNNCISSPFVSRDIKLIERFRVGKDLRKKGYTHAYLIPNSFKSALIPFWAKIPRRIGWLGEQRYFLLNDVRVLCKKRLPLMVERFAALGYQKDEKVPIDFLRPKLKVLSKDIEKTLNKLQIKLSKKPILAICPGAGYGVAKRWLPEYFAVVAEELIKEGWEIWILGGPKEKELANIIQKRSNNVCLDLTGKTDLGEVIDLLSLAAVVLVNDSGLMHVAAALGRSIIAIYGSTSPELAPPLASNESRTLWLNLPCSPCNKRECPLKHNKCMNNLEPDLVLKAITEIT